MAEPTVAMPETEPMTQAVTQPETHAAERNTPKRTTASGQEVLGISKN
jgi:hypothetical protein